MSVYNICLTALFGFVAPVSAGQIALLSFSLLQCIWWRGRWFKKLFMQREKMKSFAKPVWEANKVNLITYWIGIEVISENIFVFADLKHIC